MRYEVLWAFSFDRNLYLSCVTRNCTESERLIPRLPSVFVRESSIVADFCKKSNSLSLSGGGQIRIFFVAVETAL